MANKSKKTKSPKSKVASQKVRPSSSKKKANISKEGNSFRVRVSIDGQRISRSFKTQQEAVKWRDKAKEKQSKVIKVTKKVKLQPTKRKKVTKTSIAKGKVKAVNPNTGRKVKVKAVKIEEIKLTKPQQEKKDQDKPFKFEIMDGKVLPAMMQFAEDQQAPMFVRYSGYLIECDSDQLSELVNLLSSEYYDYARDNDIDSPTIRYIIWVYPLKKIILDLDESFFLGLDEQQDVSDEEKQFLKSDNEAFDVGFYFFQWSEQVN